MTEEAERALEQLVRELGEQLEAEDITAEEQLDEAIATAKREAFERSYGEHTPSSRPRQDSPGEH